MTSLLRIFLDLYREASREFFEREIISCNELGTAVLKKKLQLSGKRLTIRRFAGQCRQNTDPVTRTHVGIYRHEIL